MHDGNALLERIELLAQQISIGAESRKLQLEIIATLFEEITKLVTLLHIALVREAGRSDLPMGTDLQAVQDQLNALTDALRAFRKMTEAM